MVHTSAVEEEGSDLYFDAELPTLPLPPDFVVPEDADPRLWAWRKAADVATSNSRLAQNDLVLGADTIVISREKVLGKPRSLDEARTMLRLLRGTDHFVVTGFTLLQSRGDQPLTLNIGLSATRVVMKEFTESELEGYVVTGESLDKAGAYAIQGKGGKLISAVDGCITNVIGLPVCKVRSILWEAGVSLLPYPDDGYCASCPGWNGSSR